MSFLSKIGMRGKLKEGISRKPLVEVPSVTCGREHVTALTFAFTVALPTPVIRTG
jgi:hypothetical protein